uniref:Uncharacterized protein n=1 Tax=Anguilla anguilla TaxID=7936 RepID=A0A0E9RGQ6_ANGAN
MFYSPVLRGRFFIPNLSRLFECKILAQFNTNSTYLTIVMEILTYIYNVG